MKATHPPRIEPAANPAQLLHGAAGYLQLHGWTTGQFFDLLNEQPFPPACALGAITIAAHGTVTVCADHPTCPDSDAAIRAMRVFAAWLDPDYDPWHNSAIDVIADFNDHPGRTLDEILDALTTAANDHTAIPTGGAR